MYVLLTFDEVGSKFYSNAHVRDPTHSRFGSSDRQAKPHGRVGARKSCVPCMGTQYLVYITKIGKDRIDLNTETQNLL